MKSRNLYTEGREKALKAELRNTMIKQTSNMEGVVDDFEARFEIMPESFKDMKSVNQLRQGASLNRKKKGKKSLNKRRGSLKLLKRMSKKNKGRPKSKGLKFQDKESFNSFVNDKAFELIKSKQFIPIPTILTHLLDKDSRSKKDHMLFHDIQL